MVGQLGKACGTACAYIMALASAAITEGRSPTPKNRPSLAQIRGVQDSHFTSFSEPLGPFPGALGPAVALDMLRLLTVVEGLVSATFPSPSARSSKR